MVAWNHAQAQRLRRDVLPPLGERLAELAVFSAQEGERTLEALGRLVTGIARGAIGVGAEVVSPYELWLASSARQAPQLGMKGL